MRGGSQLWMCHSSYRWVVCSSLNVTKAFISSNFSSIQGKISQSLIFFVWCYHLIKSDSCIWPQNETRYICEKHQHRLNENILFTLMDSYFIKAV